MSELTKLDVDSRCRLRDGRVMMFRKYGEPSGEPIFYFHGFPGSRVEVRLAEKVIRKLGLRVIGVDRPGMGGSDFQPGRKLTDFPGDIDQLADALGVRKFSIFAVSGGGPYALACALKMDARLKKVVIACGLGPPGIAETMKDVRGLHKMAYALSSRFPKLTPFWFSPIVTMALSRPEKLLARYATMCAAPDREILCRDDIREVLAESWSEAVRSGAGGLAHELGLYSRDWGFRLEDIRREIEFWHGNADVVVPLSMAKHQASIISKSKLNVLPDEGHFSLVINHAEEMLRGIIT